MQIEIYDLNREGNIRTFKARIVYPKEIVAGIQTGHTAPQIAEKTRVYEEMLHERLQEEEDIRRLHLGTATLTQRDLEEDGRCNVK